MSISIKKDLAIDLINENLKILDERIMNILLKWHYNNIEDFIEDSKNGTLDHTSIDDAIDIQNLRDKRAEIANILD